VLTTRDDQTGLMNLGAFTFVVDHVVRRASRSGECATLLSIAVDLPEAAGAGRDERDPVPVYRVARILRTELRGEDVVARIAPLEFGVALPDTNADGGEIVVDWIVTHLHQHGIGAVGGDGPGVLIGRATFEPTHGPVDAVEILAAARQSRSGPSHVVGRDPRTKDTSAPRLARDEVAERRTLGEWTASRRHLRAVRPTDS
jgi:GGDEF domain-containing protein